MSIKIVVSINLDIRGGGVPVKGGGIEGILRAAGWFGQTGSSGP